MTPSGTKRGHHEAPDREAVAYDRFRALHVMVPEEAIWQARAAAVASRLPLKTFMARLMLTAKPLTARPITADDAAIDDQP